jgi:hypothetical protein
MTEQGQQPRHWFADAPLGPFPTGNRIAAHAEPLCELHLRESQGEPLPLERLARHTRKLYHCHSSSLKLSYG